MGAIVARDPSDERRADERQINHKLVRALTDVVCAQLYYCLIQDPRGTTTTQMTPERYKLIRRAFEAALEHDPKSRPPFVREEYRNDPELINKVLELLDALEADNFLLAEPPLTDDVAQEVDEEDLTGENLGLYQIEKLLGRGGMGSVYLAKRVDQTFERQVAIKVARFGFLRGTLVQRIRRERQILARLDHPNIAKLLDAGATESGSPFFAMEYVEGAPLTVYCDKNGLRCHPENQAVSDSVRGRIVCTSAVNRPS